GYSLCCGWMPEEPTTDQNHGKDATYDANQVLVHADKSPVVAEDEEEPPRPTSRRERVDNAEGDSGSPVQVDLKPNVEGYVDSEDGGQDPQVGRDSRNRSQCALVGVVRIGSAHIQPSFSTPGTTPTDLSVGSSTGPNFNGQGGIRTHETVAGLPVFETGPFSHSGTCPNYQTSRRLDVQTARKNETPKNDFL